MRHVITGLGTIALAVLALHATHATQATMRTEWTPDAVTIRVFHPSKRRKSGQDDVLPVDTPDAGHTTADAASFTKTSDGARLPPVAFTCLTVEAR